MDGVRARLAVQRLLAVRLVDVMGWWWGGVVLSILWLLLLLLWWWKGGVWLGLRITDRLLVHERLVEALIVTHGWLRRRVRMREG